MSISAQLQQLLTARLGEAGVLRVPAPVIARREKEIGAEIEAAAARQQGLCVWVMPALPESAIDDFPFVFFNRSEVRVRIIEQRAVNSFGVDACQLAEDVAEGLHWRGVGDLLAGPLQAAPRLTEMVSDARWRIVDVIFHAAYQLPARTVANVPLHLSGRSLSEDLQAAVIAQLSGALLAPGVPVLDKRPHDLNSAIAAAGHPLCIEVAPPLLTRAMDGNPELFIEQCEVRVKISEQPALNGTGVDAYELVEDVATTLHWQPFAGLLAYPLQISTQPTALQGDPSRREIEVIFNATAGFQS